MAKTYTITSSSINPGSVDAWRTHWSTYYATPESGRLVGYSSSLCRAVNILFRSSDLAQFYGKTITGINLIITTTGTGYVPATNYGYRVRFKANNTATGDASSQAWMCTSDDTDLATISEPIAKTVPSGTVFTLSVGRSLPTYGYVIAVTNHGTGTITLASTATLEVTTTETDRTFRLSYSANGGSGTPVTQQVTTTGSSVTFTVNPNGTSVTKDGYTFLGWSTSSSATTATYTNGQSITVSSNTILYAVWGANTYTVLYNKGSYGTGTNTSVTKTYNVPLTLKGALFTRTGYVQDGWATSDGGASVYALSGTYSDNRSIVLYPSWQAMQSRIYADNGTLSTQIAITIQRYNENYRHVVSYSYGSANGTISTSATTSVNWVPPISLSSEFPNSTSGTCTLLCQTYDGANYIGSSSTSIVLSIPESVKCTVSGVTLTETETDVATKFGAFVQNKSKIQITGTTSNSIAYGATVKSYSIKTNVQTLTTNGAVTNLIYLSGSVDYTFSIEDSRGRTDTYSGTYTVYPYVSPDVSATIERDSTVPSTVNVNYTYRISDVNNRNDKQIVIKYRQKGVNTWTTAATIVPNSYSGSGTYSVQNIDADTTHQFMVVATDYYTSATTSSYVYAVGNRIFSISRADRTIARHGDNPSDGWDHQYYKERFHENVQFDGAVDVVNRRCYENLPSAGWYRVLTFHGQDASAIKGSRGLEIRLNIQRVGENHSITFRTVGENLVYWTDETSKSSTMLVDKIRYNYNESAVEGYIDIHYTYSQTRLTGVDFDVHTSALVEQGRVTANNLESVADAPSVETVMSTYSFTENGSVPNQSIFTSLGNLSTTGSRLLHEPASVSLATATWKTIATLTLDVGVYLLVGGVRFASNATGIRRCQMSKTADADNQFGVISNLALNAVNGTYTYCNVTWFANVTADDTVYYLNAYQNSGSALTTYGRFYAVKII